MKVKKIIIGLGCLCLLATGNVFASNSSPSSHCGKQADAALFLLDYSGSMMRKVKQGESESPKITLAKQLLKEITPELKDSEISLGIGSVAPFNLFLAPSKYESDRVSKALSEAPEDLEIFGRNTNIGEGFLEITNLLAPNEKNRVALKNLGEDPIFIVFSDNPTSTRGIELEKAFKEAKVKYRKSKFVLIYFPDEKNGNAIPSANLFDKYYDGLQLLNNKESLSSFVSDELFRDCAFNLSADTLFAFDGSSLSQKGKAEIKKVSSQIKARTKELLAASSYLSISAYTDRLGSDSYNQTLSEKRLHAVLNELKNNSVDMKLIKEAKAFGEAKPVTGNECLDLPRKEQIRCYQPDRRVEIKVIK